MRLEVLGQTRTREGKRLDFGEDEHRNEKGTSSFGENKKTTATRERNLDKRRPKNGLHLFPYPGWARQIIGRPRTNLRKEVFLTPAKEKQTIASRYPTMTIFRNCLQSQIALMMIHPDTN